MSPFHPFSLVAGNRQRPLTCLGDASELLSRPANGFDRAMTADNFMRDNTRKWWEWGYLAECAEACGVLHADSRGIGLGAGSEPLMFHFANHSGEVVATDLYSADTIWKEAKVAHTDVIIRESPIALKRDNLRITNGDMRALPVESGSFDFAWSCSSIEHIDTVADLVRIFEELARILRPGGIALLTTEYCLTEAPYLLPGLTTLDDELFSAIVVRNPAFRLVGETDLRFHWAFPGNNIKPRRDLPQGMEMLNQGLAVDRLRNRTMAVPVGQSVIVPIAFTLERTAEPALDWQSIDLRPDIRAYSDCLGAMHDGRLAEAHDALRRLLTDPEDALSTQFEAHVRKNLVGVMALQFENGDVEATALADEAERLMDVAVSGLVADGDCFTWPETF